jgi:hypothetical protein
VEERSDYKHDQSTSCTHEDRTMKPVRISQQSFKLLELARGNGGMDLIKAHCVHGWKHHSPLCAIKMC